MRELARRTFTVDEYYRMAETGILSPEDRTELIEGEIIKMTPIGKRHAVCVYRLTALFTERLQHRAIVSVQNPIRIDSHTEPQPDVSLLRWRDDFYSGTPTHPGPQDVLLVIEVADTSVEYDRSVKIPMYGKANIPDAWLIDQAKDTIEIFSQPLNGIYQHTHKAQHGDTITVLGITVTVDEILGQKGGE